MPVGGGLEHFDGCLARLGRDAGHAPERGDLGAVLWVGQVAVRAELVGQRPYLAPAHGVGLAGERQRPRARPADLTAGQVQVDEGGVVVRAVGGLVQALAVQAERGQAGARAFLHSGKPARGLQQVGRGNAAMPLDGLGRGLGHERGQAHPALGARGDEILVEPALLDHAAQHAVVEPHVRAGPEREVQVGYLGAVRAARVADDDPERGVGALGVLYAPKQYRVRPGRVGAADEQRGGLCDVLVAGGRCVGAQRGLVAGHGAAHA